MQLDVRRLVGPGLVWVAQAKCRAYMSSRYKFEGIWRNFFVQPPPAPARGDTFQNSLQQSNQNGSMEGTGERTGGHQRSSKLEWGVCGMYSSFEGWDADPLSHLTRTDRLFQPTTPRLPRHKSGEVLLESSAVMLSTSERILPEGACPDLRPFLGPLHIPVSLTLRACHAAIPLVQFDLSTAHCISYRRVTVT